MKKLVHPDVRIEPTNMCNYNCVMCPRDKHTRKHGVMDMGLYKRVIDEVVPMGAKQITLVNFGEPFIDYSLADKIHYANQKGLRTYTVTNGSLMHKKDTSEFARDKNISKIEAAAQAGLTELRLSFYGTTKERYENIMRGGNFETVVENLKLLKRIRDKCGNPQVSVYFLQMDKCKGLSREAKDFIQYTKPFADFVEIWRPHNFGDGRSFRDVSSKVKTTCGRPMLGPLHVNWDGIVMPCCFDYNAEVVLGDVTKNSIEEIIDGKPWNDLIEMHKSGNFRDSFCGACDQLQKHEDSLLYSTNPLHKGMTKKTIMKTVNSMPDVKMEDTR